MKVHHLNTISNNAFDKSRLFMAFLRNFGDTRILYSFRLMEGKVSKETTESWRLEFLEKFSQTMLPYQMQKTNLRAVSGFVFAKNSTSNLQEVMRPMFLGYRLLVLLE